MTNKTKKITLLTAGIAGTLLASSVAAVTLSACTIQAALPPNYVDPNAPASTPSVQYNTKINWNIQTNEDWELGMPIPVNRLEQDENGFIYADKNHTQLIAMLPSIKVSEITIPAQVQQISGYVDITTNDDGTHTAAFENNTNLRTVKFAPGSKLKAINTNAFKGCTNLQTIQLPSTVKTIGNGSFQNTKNLTDINLGNVTYIGNNAFSGAFTTDASVNLNIDLSNVLRIGDSAFQNVSNVKAIDLSKNSKLLSIGANAFKGATLAETFDLSKSKGLSAIGNNAFENTTNVQTIILPEGFGFGSTPLGNAVFKNSSITSIDLRNTIIKSIPNNTFENASNLTDVKLNDEITDLGNNSFTGTSSLKSLALPSKLSNVNQAFKESLTSNPTTKSGITELDFSGTQVTQFTTSAFEGAENLTKITLNDKFTRIGGTAFKNANALATIGPKGTPDNTLKLPASFGVEFNTSANAFEGNIFANVDLSETKITTLSHDVFAGNNAIKTIKYPSTLRTLNGADGALPSLVSADLSNTRITAIPNNAFKSAVMLESVTLPNSITTIGVRAFEGTKISSIELPEGITVINDNAFRDTKALKTITVRPTNSNYSIKATKEGTGAILPSTVREIKSEAFRGSALELIDLSNTKIDQIQNWTFGDCEELTTIYVPKTLNSLRQRIFAYEGGGPLNLNLDEGNISTARLTTFGTKEDLGVDEGTNRATIAKVILPSTITNIDNNAFEYSGISDIDLSKISSFKTSGPDNNKYGLGGMNYMFNGATQLKTVIFPSWTKGKFGDSIFRTTKSLMSVTVDKLTTRSTYVDEPTTPEVTSGTLDISNSNIIGFNGPSQFLNSNLGTFRFPEKFDRTNIPQNSFNGTKLTEIKVQNSTTRAIVDNNILGENTTTINDGAFNNIPTLTKIELPSSYTTINNSAFSNISPEATITYSSGVSLTGTTTTTNAYANTLVSAIDLSTSTDLTTLSAGTFNNATKLNKITLPAKAVQWKTTETTSGTTTTYSNNPFFNNSKTLNIEFTAFTKNGNTAPDQFSDIDNQVKQQIANIMNMFSNYVTIDGARPNQYNGWTARVGTDALNSWIDTDFTNADVFNNWKQPNSATEENLDDNKNGYTKNHNGVTWTYNKATSRTAGDITITSSPINMYRTISDSNWNTDKFQANQGRQTYFSAPTINGSPDQTVKVIVTMRIVNK